MNNGSYLCYFIPSEEASSTNIRLLQTFTNNFAPGNRYAAISSNNPSGFLDISNPRYQTSDGGLYPRYGVS